MQKYVVVSNMLGNDNMFSDHQGVARVLAPAGAAGCSIKLILDTVDPTELERYIRRYMTLGKNDQFACAFSGNIDLKGIRPVQHKLEVISTAHVDQQIADRVSFIRSQMAKKSQEERLDAARNSRVQAVRTAHLTEAEIAATAKQPQKDVDDKPVQPSITVNADNVGGVTKEYLDTLSKEQLYVAASGLGLSVKKGASVGGIKKAIMLSLSKNVQVTPGASDDTPAGNLVEPAGDPVN